MSLLVDPAARQEAVAVRMGDIGEREIRFGQRALDMALHARDSAVMIAAGNLKPRYVGHLGILVADSVELVLQDQSAHGIDGLVRYTAGLDSEIRHATAADMKNLNALSTTWEHTLMYALAAPLLIQRQVEARQT
ncbi:MAG TPA: hypothetical protein VLG47_00580 [Candidatus Saccharimonadales bacterium]|nr:hypothetical protein [Candidatus Saccharimonadales bacterium]